MILVLGQFEPQVVFENVKGDLDYQLIKKLEECSSDNSIDQFKLPLSLEDTPSDPNNTLTKERFELGKLLFYNENLSVNTKRPDTKGKVSCASCHSPNHAWKSGLVQAIGDGGIGDGEDRIENKSFSPDDIDRQNVSTPTILNIAYQSVLGWTGQFGGAGLNSGLAPSPMVNSKLNDINSEEYEGAVSQALIAINVHRLGMNEELARELDLIDLFDDAFPYLSEDERYSIKTVAFALDAYQRGVISNEAPFQKWLHGEHDAMGDSEKRGAILFFGKAGCSSCHNNAALSSMTFHAVGMKDLSQNDDPSVTITKSNPPEDKGREMVTCNSDDRHDFKVPQLYNLSDFNFYGHGSSFKSVRAVVEYFNEGMPEKDIAISPDFNPVGLKPYEIDDLVAFLEIGLYDNYLERYLPEGL